MSEGTDTTQTEARAAAEEAAAQPTAPAPEADRSAAEGAPAGPPEADGPTPARADEGAPTAARPRAETAFAEAEAPSDGAEAEAVQHDLEALSARARERDEYLALAQRTQADFENFRKRAARDAAQAADRGITRLAKELLPALDHLELALQATEQQEGAEEVVKGFRLVHSELVGALGRVGIEPIVPHGEAFDPTEHEAMAQMPQEGAAAGRVIQVYQPGYRLHGSVLRPARVVVAA
jgi:molecular chaperone GrpE